MARNKIITKKNLNIICCFSSASPYYLWSRSMIWWELGLEFTSEKEIISFGKTLTWWLMHLLGNNTPALILEDLFKWTPNSSDSFTVKSFTTVASNLIYSQKLNATIVQFLRKRVSSPRDKLLTLFITMNKLKSRIIFITRILSRKIKLNVLVVLKLKLFHMSSSLVVSHSRNVLLILIGGEYK